MTLPFEVKFSFKGASKIYFFTLVVKLYCQSIMHNNATDEDEIEQISSKWSHYITTMLFFVFGVLSLRGSYKEDGYDCCLLPFS